MIKLTELLHSINTENKDGLVPIDDWKLPHIEHLIDMGFEIMDDHHINTPKDPKISVYKKKGLDEANGKKTEYFFVEEPKRGIRKFGTFDEVIIYFDHYEQPELKNLQ